MLSSMFCSDLKFGVGNLKKPRYAKKEKPIGAFGDKFPQVIPSKSTSVNAEKKG